jgi:tetratricopeptide (TPR) repeat protein
MAILDKTGQQAPLTEGWRALELFTDRHEAIRLFSSFLNDDPPHERILFFYGDGGNGKSLLLRFMREHYFKHFSLENWKFIQSTIDTDADFEWHLRNAEGSKPVPFALLDFGMRPVGEDRPQEAFSGLMMLRRALGHSAREQGYSIRFPLYDFACLSYLHETHNPIKDRLQSLLPTEETEFIGEIVNALSATSLGTLGKAVLNILSKHSREWLALYRQRRNLDEERVQIIRKMRPESELIDHLPLLFAEDLNVAMSLNGAPKRVLLLFDTHERLWGDQRKFAHELFFERDEWLRCLLAAIEPSAGIVAVVAGRNRPRWSGAGKCRIPEENVEPFFVGHLSTTDAMGYLERAGVSDIAMCRSLVFYARVEPDQVHPLYLGLCADVALAALKKGEMLPPEYFRNPPPEIDKGRELMHRLLLYVDVEVDYAVRALCACRAFDVNLYLALGRALNFHVSVPTFHSVLIQFSFVWQAEQRGKGWYRIHELLRRLRQERDDEVTLQAHEFLERYYRECVEAGETTAMAEAIYHANRLDWNRGFDEWGTTFIAALDDGRYELCRALLSIRHELIVETDSARGAMSSVVGDFFKSLIQYDEARQEYLDAVDRFDDALRNDPEYFTSYNDKGHTLQRLGELQAELSEYAAAIESYSKAIACYNEALRLTPDYVIAHRNKGSASVSLGELHATLSQYQEATDSYVQAISACNEALLREPDCVPAYTIKGTASQKLGLLKTRQSEYAVAVACYAHAITAFDGGLLYKPEDLGLLNNRGNALRSIGELQAILHRAEEAERSYEQAIAIFNKALGIAPDYIFCLNNKAYALQRLGELQAAQSRGTAAEESYKKSIMVCNETLKHAPDYVLARNNKGNALRSLGELQEKQSEYDEAISSYMEAVAAFDATIQRAPKFIIAHNNKAITLWRLGELHALLLQPAEALKNYQAALAEFDLSLEISPGDMGVLAMKTELQTLIEKWQKDRASI